jgi:hypothetical protein
MENRFIMTLIRRRRDRQGRSVGARPDHGFSVYNLNYRLGDEGTRFEYCIAPASD